MSAMEVKASAVEVKASTLTAGKVKASATAADVVPAQVTARKSRSLSEEVELDVLIYVPVIAS